MKQSLSLARLVASAFLILIVVSAVVIQLSQPACADAIPVAHLPDGTTWIDEIGYYEVSYRYLDGRTGSMPMGWIGNFDDNTGISAIPSEPQNGKRAYLIHPIWRGGTGDTDQTFRLAIPNAKSIFLSFSIAMRSDAVGKSDGVTFRVFVNGDKVLDQNKANGAWSDYRFDLTRFAGKTIALTFEANPGPANNSSFDFGLWGDRRIAIAGTSSTPVVREFKPKPAPLDQKETGWGSASPTHPISSENIKRISTFESPSPHQLFDGLNFRLTTGKTTSSLAFASGATLDLVAPDGKIVSSESVGSDAKITQEATTNGGIRRTVVYILDGRAITVVADIDHYDGSSVRIRLHSTDPYIAAVHFGRIGPTAFQRQVIVPYYGQVVYSASLGLFSNVVADYGLSHSSRLSNDAAQYLPLTDGRRIALDETAYYAVAPDIRDVLPTPIGAPSPYRQTMGDLAVIDYWDGHAEQLADRLQDWSTYGLNHFLTIIHNWQHGGYDQELPAVLPANDSIGGNDGLIALTTKAKGLGERVALHENYVDFYPNGPLYNKSEIAVHSDGSLIPAWMFPGHVSYLMTPVAMLKYAGRITPQVHSEIGTNSSYLDVHSAITPFDHTDFRANRKGAGEFITCLHAQQDLWQLMRNVHGGPVLGEGANHWYWSGMLDGVEAQFGVGVPGNCGENAPLFVDFDLLKIHPRQINHGMGYIERWMSTEATEPISNALLDEYRMQEIAYGHSAFVSTSSQTLTLPFAWEEHNLAIPVESRTSLAHVRSIVYETNGSMMETSDAIANGTKFDRVRIRYDNGVTVWANSRPAPWTIEALGQKIMIPQYGWLASGPDLLAYMGEIGGGAATFARTASSIYANSRTAIVINTDSPRPYATPHIYDMAQTGSRAFRVTFGFDVTRNIPAAQRPFVHLVALKPRDSNDIAMQFPTGISTEPATWRTGSLTRGEPVDVTLPHDIQDGDYEIRIGLYNPNAGERLLLDGIDDNQKRYRMASLTVSDNGATITIEPIVSQESQSKLITRMANFGVISTNGSVKLTKSSPGQWVLIPLPRNVSFHVTLGGADIDPAFTRIFATPIDANGKPIGSGSALPVQNGYSALTIDLPQGAIGYLLTGMK